ncbi:hypothetical protein JOQ06_010424, partial [Pogonophryne albipinna]
HNRYRSITTVSGLEGTGGERALFGYGSSPAWLRRSLRLGGSSRITPTLFHTSKAVIPTAFHKKNVKSRPEVRGGVGRRAPGEGISAGMKSMRFLCGSPAGLLGNSQPEACEDTQVSRKSSRRTLRQRHAAGSSAPVTAAASRVTQLQPDRLYLYMETPSWAADL